MSKITIAIDGYSSCGKSTLAKSLAANLGYAYVDSGAMYRCVALYGIQKGAIKDHSFIPEAIIRLLPEINISFEFNKTRKASDTILNGVNVEKEIRDMKVSEVVSEVSAIHEVRVKMVGLQRELGKDGGIVMDGRDIGSNVFPNAELKIFMTADPDIRAQRRYQEYQDKGSNIDISEVKKNLIHRDYEDSHRKENPLIQAEDAIVIDNSELTPADQLGLVLQLIHNMTLAV